MPSKPEIYVSTDIEADGPIPGMNSMLSFGSAAYLADKTLIGIFTANLDVLPEATPDPKTMEWWRGQPEAWKACRENLQSPEVAMRVYVAWLKNLPGIPVFVGYPAAYDFMFVYWYLKPQIIMAVPGVHQFLENDKRQRSQSLIQKINLTF